MKGKTAHGEKGNRDRGAAAQRQTSQHSDGGTRTVMEEADKSPIRLAGLPMSAATATSTRSSSGAARMIRIGRI
jgi:hypothetical protein